MTSELIMNDGAQTTIGKQGPVKLQVSMLAIQYSNSPKKIPNAALSPDLRQLATTTWHMRGPK